MDLKIVTLDNGRFTYVLDGDERYHIAEVLPVTYEVVEGYATIAEAVESALPVCTWGGYNAAYYAECLVLCPKCARELAMQALTNGDDTAYEDERELLAELKMESTDGDYSGGLSCDCGEYIREPYCEDCGTDIAECEGSPFWRTSGDSVLCRSCMAKYVHTQLQANAGQAPRAERWRTRAEKLGKGTYRVVEDAPTFGRWNLYGVPAPDVIPSHMPRWKGEYSAQG